MAGSVVIFSSLLVVVTASDQISRLRSLDTRERMERTLAGPIGDVLGRDLESYIRLTHAMGLVAAACATATAVLGWYAMRRDKTARVVLSVLAVPVLLSGLFLGGFASSFVAAAAAMLWLWPAREWFATGRWTPPPPRPTSAARASGTSGTTTRPTSWPPTPPTSSPGSRPDAGPDSRPDAGPDSRPDSPHGSSPSQAPPHPRPYGEPFAGQHATPYPPAPGRPPAGGVTADDRPTSVVVAVVLATVTSAVVGMLALAAIIVAAMSPNILVEAWEQQQSALGSDGLSESQVRSSVLFAGGVGLALCGLALTFAGFLSVGREWARRGLMATAAFSAGSCVLVTFTAPQALLPAVAAVATVVLLNRPDAQAWCRSGPRRRR